MRAATATPGSGRASGFASASRAAGRANAAGRAGRGGSAGFSAGRGQGARGPRKERSIFGVPERFMGPRLVLIAAIALLVGFGALMVYSASSVEALEEVSITGGNAAYYVIKQLQYAAIGTVAAAVIAKVDYRFWTFKALPVIWVFSVLLLFIVFTPLAGRDASANGATRWIRLGGFRLQPSEFVKITIILTGANLANACFEEGSIDIGSFYKWLFIGVALPTALILFQPDKGSTMVIGITLLVMGYLAGIDERLIVGLLVLSAVVFFAYSVKDDYSRKRLLAMLNPWSDPTDNGYQLIHGYYAFGTGGLFGMGLGMSRQKYSYLPEAHNDFILSIVGEEFGLVGTLALVAGFAVVLWAGYRIARYAPDLAGRLVAAGCTTILIVQMLLNVCGVLGLFPMSGKPIPFISYGGSSIMASLMLVGMILSVSIHSTLPETEGDRARRSFSSADAAPAGGAGGFSLVGEARPRSARGRAGGAGAGMGAYEGVGTPVPRSAGRLGTGSAGAAAGRGGSAGRAGSGGRAGAASGDGRGGAQAGPRVRSGFTVVSGGRAEGGRGGTGRGGSGAGRPRGQGDAGRKPRGRVTTDANGRRRIDLGPSATDRLRGRH